MKRCPSCSKTHAPGPTLFWCGHWTAIEVESHGTVRRHLTLRRPLLSAPRQASTQHEILFQNKALSALFALVRYSCIASRADFGRFGRPLLAHHPCVMAYKKTHHVPTRSGILPFARAWTSFAPCRLRRAPRPAYTLQQAYGHAQVEVSALLDPRLHHLGSR
jgi:hypothetical protein